MINKTFKVGDKVKIKLDKVLDKYKKYNKIYKIIEVRKINDELICYKLKGVPDWGLYEELEKVEE